MININTMNKKIQELARRAGLQPYYDAQQRQIDKFADLIVEECAQASEKYWNDAGLQRAFSPSEYIYDVMESTSVTENTEDPIAKIDRLFRGQ